MKTLSICAVVLFLNSPASAHPGGLDATAVTMIEKAVGIITTAAQRWHQHSRVTRESKRTNENGFLLYWGLCLPIK